MPGRNQVLSDGQREVIRQLAEGTNLKTVAADLAISESAVKARLVHARVRMGARNTVQLVAMAVSQGLVSPQFEAEAS
jgi:LuxR family transcriptional regulator